MKKVQRLSEFKKVSLAKSKDNKSVKQLEYQV